MLAPEDIYFLSTAEFPAKANGRSTVISSSGR
jgi:hypothetical protein